VYDADGNVLLQKDPGKTTLFLFGGAEQLVLNTGTGAVTGTRFLALPGGGQVVRTGAGTTRSRGSPVLVIVAGHADVFAHNAATRGRAG
jgi:hypothetical protein